MQIRLPRETLWVQNEAGMIRIRKHFYDMWAPRVKEGDIYSVLGGTDLAVHIEIGEEWANTVESVGHYE